MTTFEEKQAARHKRIVDRAERAAERAATRARESALSKLKIRTMSPTQYRAALKKQDITVVGAAAYFGISRRQAQRIASEGPVPKLVQKILELLSSEKLKKEDLL